MKSIPTWFGRKADLVLNENSSHYYLHLWFNKGVGVWTDNLDKNCFLTIEFTYIDGDWQYCYTRDTYCNSGPYHFSDYFVRKINEYIASKELETLLKAD